MVRKLSFRTIIQEENHGSPLENIHREMKLFKMRFRILKSNGYILTAVEIAGFKTSIASLRDRDFPFHLF